MDDKTQSQLTELTEQFYRQVGTDFDRTRQTFWPGWTHLLPFFQGLPDTPLTVVDLGCGNGRFALFLDHHQLAADYTGVDDNSQLLALAQQQRLDMPTNYQQQSITTWLSNAQKSDLVVERLIMFGVYHHIPGQTTRTKLIQQLSQQLTDNGLLILSLWRWAENPQLASKALWQPSQLDIDYTQLEPGDGFLGWGKTDQIRYCHSFSDAEISELITASQLDLVKQFRADGSDQQTNHYLVLAKSGQAQYSH